jgi:pectate lyase
VKQKTRSCFATSALLIASVSLLSSCALSGARQHDIVSTHAEPAAAYTPVSDGGWAGHLQPVTGGAGASKHRTYRVRNRGELVEALSPSDVARANVPKIIHIEGVIDLSVDAANRSLKEFDYRDAAFSWDAFARAYSPSVWGKTKPAGPEEDARAASARNQERVVVLPVGSNTSLIGVGVGATLKNGGLLLRDVENVVIRNIAFEDAYDYFPSWDPGDNANGEWNSAYDNISLVNARRVWVDFCTFSDGDRPDSANRSLLGRRMQFHDGLLDVVRGSDLITISNSVFRNHDKVMLIGNSDSRTDDEGRLRVTLHNNWFDNVRERAPRVRYGQVHVYNNLYTSVFDASYPYSYSIGIGVSSKIFAEANAFVLASNLSARAFRWWGGDRVSAKDNHYFEGGEWRLLEPAAPSTGTAARVHTSAPEWHIPYRYRAAPTQELPARLRGRVGAGTEQALARTRTTQEAKAEP